MDISDLDAEEVKAILEMTEGHYLDFKRKEIKPGKLSETISAFANASGGEVFLGVAQDDIGSSTAHRWDGFHEPEAANAHIQALESLGALGNHYQANFLRSPSTGGLVLHLVIPKTKGILKATDGHAYVRRNAQNIRIDTHSRRERSGRFRSSG